MLVNKKIFKEEIFKRKFNENYYQCAKALKVTSSQLHRFINTDSQAGSKLLGGIYEYCEKEKLKFRDLIFLPSEIKKY
ncbi:XRE family transcriptional regulator [Crassaminicella thermophila]|uniref:XRE family transcriptional regulator n=1 Tax=Crassaminicella thermophila TaxID=2599308 RepID=A0A5C0SEG3_CRATE|nr:XRE family transcriptional regulator [Crassaminicella thermophila]QEK12711.1 XRE family transcriptional regulator [Crassaminicella thermophila]